jgi:hypothetical protein
MITAAVAKVGGGHGGRRGVQHGDAGCCGVHLDGGAHVEAVHVGKMHVEDHDVGLPDPLQGLGAGRSLHHHQSGASQPGREDEPAALAVVDDENDALRRHWTPR